MEGQPTKENVIFLTYKYTKKLRLPDIRMLNRAQEFTASVDFSNFDKALQMLHASNAFLEPQEGKLRVG